MTPQEEYEYHVNSIRGQKSISTGDFESPSSVPNSLNSGMPMTSGLMTPQSKVQMGLRIPAHFWRHCLSATFAIAVSVACELIVVEHFKHKEINVTWADGSISTGYIPHDDLIELNSRVIVGFGSDGKTYWKRVTMPTKNPEQNLKAGPASK